MDIPRTAAVARRDIWKAHDEEDWERCSTAAAELFETLAPVSGVPAGRAGEREATAFQLADYAEALDEQGQRSAADRFYDAAGDCLHEARRITDLSTAYVPHRVQWWKAYRRGDKEQVRESLSAEQHSRFPALSADEVGDAVTHLLTAAEAHKERDWAATADYLTAYYQLVLDTV